MDGNRGGCNDARNMGINNTHHAMFYIPRTNAPTVEPHLVPCPGTAGRRPGRGWPVVVVEQQAATGSGERGLQRHNYSINI